MISLHINIYLNNVKYQYIFESAKEANLITTTMTTFTQSTAKKICILNQITAWTLIIFGVIVGIGFIFVLTAYFESIGAKEASSFFSFWPAAALAAPLCIAGFELLD